MQPPIKVMIVDPHASMRMAVALLLGAEAGLEVRHVVGDLAAARRALGDIDVALVDAGLIIPATGASADVAAVRSRAAVVAMGVDDPRFYGPAASAAGAVGYWLKDGEVSDLLGLIADAGRQVKGAAQASATSVTRIDGRSRRRERRTGLG
jgi:DNA-binding NarL/FixJ family response regulator